ncbi:MAG: DEAD/DEAH box helicase [Cytophagales bacterium]|nr:MAG: DEAD/DEAH box helicase [Cytophagales bacterium]
MKKNKEAQARIKINELLIKAGWRFFDEGKKKANVICEDRITKKTLKSDELGNDFELTKNGFVDYVLLDDYQNPIAIIEAKRENINPLAAIDQAKIYADAKRVRHIFLSNGEYHYYWNKQEMPTPQPITEFLTYQQLGEVEKWKPKIKDMQNVQIDENYIAISQESQWYAHDKQKQDQLKKDKKVTILRNYQVEGIKKLQLDYCKHQKQRFLFEMATGTGKTLLSAAIIKLFLRAGCAKRVLFLVDRIELENQAKESFSKYLQNDAIKTIIYKENKQNWKDFDIVVTTIQSLAINDRYRKLFNPADFQLVISDEAHRTISGNNRAIFEYFIGVKLGLTATPRNYLKGVNMEKLKDNNLAQFEERQLRDTYLTFGCENGLPTFQFDLLKGVKAGILCNPFVIDARTEITTEMLSKEGYNLTYTDDEGNEQDDTYFKKDYARKFTSKETNRTFIKTFLENAKRDPLTGEIGKTIVFAVSRKHATNLVQILNEEIEKIHPNKYKNYEFAKQITSGLENVQDYTKNFNHDKNNLEGKTKFNPNFEEYHSSRTRVCVTVAMMTTGYDCQDLLNIVLCRPIMSPTEFVQIKGRGTRLYTFQYNKGTNPIKPIEKDNFVLFDFFGNYEYFEKDFQYHKKIELPKPNPKNVTADIIPKTSEPYNYTGFDQVTLVKETEIGMDGMKIDREMFAPTFEEKVKTEVKNNPILQKAYNEENWDFLSAFVKNQIFDKPKEFWNIDSLCDAYEIDRRLTMQEILMKTFGKIDKFKTRTDLINEAFQTFLIQIQDKKINENINELYNLFFCYLFYADIREKINNSQFGEFATDNRLTTQQLITLEKENIDLVKNYIHDNVILNFFQKR